MKAGGGEGEQDVLRRCYAHALEPAPREIERQRVRVQFLTPTLHSLVLLVPSRASSNRHQLHHRKMVNGFMYSTIAAPLRPARVDGACVDGGDDSFCLPI